MVDRSVHRSGIFKSNVWGFQNRYLFDKNAGKKVARLARLAAAGRRRRGGPSETGSAHYPVGKEGCSPWLPPVLFEKRYVELTTEQERAYTELKTQFVTELEGEEFAALHVLSRVTKLLEITSGFLYRDDEPTYRFKQSSKVAELKDVLQQIGDKQVMIWTAFRADMDLIAQSLDSGALRQIHGDTPIENVKNFLTPSSAASSNIYALTPPASARG